MRDLSELDKRLLFIMHTGCVEIRNLARAGANPMIHDLADILEAIPSYLAANRGDSEEILREEFARYQAKHGNKCVHNYVDMLNSDNPAPESF